jgi:hypothetical protein
MKCPLGYNVEQMDMDRWMDKNRYGGVVTAWWSRMGATSTRRYPASAF